jgi:hypothetical protein
MKHLLTIAAAAVLGVHAAGAAERSSITGEYVEARTAEVFAGGCVMNSEAGTMGRQAVLAWRITQGTYRGVVLDGLTVVAAIAGDRNLGMREMGGEEATEVLAVISVDMRANPAQRDALVALARELSGGLITRVVRVETAPIRFATTAKYIEVTVADTVQLAVNKELAHDPSCGAMQWFTPFTQLASSKIGVADAHAYSGTGLGTRWSAPGKRSAFFGTFSY